MRKGPLLGMWKRWNDGFSSFRWKQNEENPSFCRFQILASPGIRYMDCIVHIHWKKFHVIPILVCIDFNTLNTLTKTRWKIVPLLLQYLLPTFWVITFFSKSWRPFRWLSWGHLIFISLKIKGNLVVVSKSANLPYLSWLAPISQNLLKNC